MLDQLYDAFQPFQHVWISSKKFMLHSSGQSGRWLVSVALDSKKVTSSIAIDLSKAFDSMCQNFLAELRAYGVGEEAIAFFAFKLVCSKAKS